MDKMLAKIAACTDPTLLKRWVKNGTMQANDAIVRAARLRLYQVLPAADPGTLAFDVWQSIHALEDLETAQRGKTIRLGRTRQSIGKVGEQACVERLLLKVEPSTGFDMLVAHGMPHLLFEAVALRHAEEFSESALAQARMRLASLEQGLA